MRESEVPALECYGLLMNMTSRFLIIALTLLAGPAFAVDRVVFRQNGQPHEVVGEPLLEAQDGGMLFQSIDGQIWTIQSEEIEDRQSDEAMFEPMKLDDVVAPLVSRLGDDYRVYRTAHYAIVSNASPKFAEYCGGLFEKLYKGFYAFWKNNRLDLPEARFPLVALVFNNNANFQRFATPEAGEAAKSIIGYYNLQSNRMTTYDVSDGAGARAGIFVVDRNIATLIHEATHQLAYNCGLQKRYADNPFWVSEGMAVFFESPDLSGRGDGWRKIGRINEVNRLRFAQYLRARPSDSLLTLIQDDARFKSSETATMAYGEAWALTYFLVKTKSKQYVEYLKKLSEGQYLASLGPRERVAMFREAFGEDLDKLDGQFIAYTKRYVLRR